MGRGLADEPDGGLCVVQAVKRHGDGAAVAAGQHHPMLLQIAGAATQRNPVRLCADVGPFHLAIGHIQEFEALRVDDLPRGEAGGQHVIGCVETLIYDLRGIVARHSMQNLSDHIVPSLWRIYTRKKSG